MNNEILDRVLSTPRGRFVGLVSRKSVPVLKKHEGITVEKVSRFVARIGVVYDNQGRVIEKRESGVLPEENQGLPWGEWAVYPYTINHKGETYVRLTPTYNDNFPPKTAYFVNGVETAKDEALAFCRKQSESGDLNCFNLKLSNIEEFHAL